MIGRDTPVEKLRRPPPPSPRTTLAISPTVRITASGVGVGADGSSATTSWLKPATGTLVSRARTACTQARTNRSCSERTSSGERVVSSSFSSVSATTTTIGRAMSQPSEAACDDGVGRVPGAPGEGVAQELGAVLALDRRDGLLLGDGQGRDGGRPLEHVHVGGGEGPLGREGPEQAVVGRRRRRS